MPGSRADPQRLDRLRCIVAIGAMSHILRHLPALLLVGAIWGLTPALGKLALVEGMRPLGVAAGAATVAAVLLLALSYSRGTPPPWDRPHLLQYATGGIFGLALAHFFAFTGLARAPAGLFAMIVPLSGLLTVLFFAMAGIERATARGVLGAVLGLAGVALAMAPGAALPDPALLPYAALMVMTPVCYALANLFSVKYAVRGTPPLAQAAGTMVFAAASAALLAWPLGHLVPPRDLGVAAIVLGQGSITAIAYLLYFHLLVAAGGVYAGQTAYVVTLAGLVWGFLLFAEVPGPLTLPAALLIFAGIGLVTLAKRAPR
jgi:drug/metabolite transporter (DMT)-like permease